jgi:hypothetical protein
MGLHRCGSGALAAKALAAVILGESEDHSSYLPYLPRDRGLKNKGPELPCECMDRGELIGIRAEGNFRANLQDRKDQ